MIGENIDQLIAARTKELLNNSKHVEMPDDLIETDNIGEVIEKLSCCTSLTILSPLKSYIPISIIKIIKNSAI